MGNMYPTFRHLHNGQIQVFCASFTCTIFSTQDHPFLHVNVLYKILYSLCRPKLAAQFKAIIYAIALFSKIWLKEVPSNPVRAKNHISPGDHILPLVFYFPQFLYFSQKTRHVFVKHGCPRRQQSQNMAKISKSYILTHPTPRGMGCQ